MLYISEEVWSRKGHECEPCPVISTVATRWAFGRGVSQIEATPKQRKQKARITAHLCRDLTATDRLPP